ncbi:MAG TPA: GNAT family N-acetyltransferase [Microthrixaceae bacterium]|nr:GNAT family N-acetyltransferase [Acidimicrobiales bacterium]RTL05735.1 MAG: GNAT family N-acetyltransferase [Acidimicrobiia bacterium]HMU79379.1 GNAT family N-acetyltransferase [Microthrixaceae bacterium]HMX64361.1 GNAT family N-acetyltransferase [Microthrixaceae bacterium]HNA35834.1 GNAT family N-acetyltransferase [Microthrixaceae bacterium]
MAQTATPTIVGGSTGLAVITDDPLYTFTPEKLDPELVSEHTTPETDIGRVAERFVYEIYRVSGFCKESERGVVEETEPWRPGSALHIVRADDQVLGTVRTLLGTYQQLPIGQFEPIVTPPTGRLCEVASLAVKPDRRGMGVANELHRMTFEFGVRQQVEGFCFLVDSWMVTFFEDYYAFPVTRMAPIQDYMGGQIEPIYVPMDQLLIDFPSRRPFAYEVAISGFTPQEIVDFDLPIILR